MLLVTLYVYDMAYAAAIVDIRHADAYATFFDMLMRQRMPCHARYAADAIAYVCRYAMPPLFRHAAIRRLMMSPLMPLIALDCWLRHTAAFATRFFFSPPRLMPAPTI